MARTFGVLLALILLFRASAKPVAQPTFLTVQGLSEMLRVAPRTIYRWRVDGWGPPGLKVGGRVLYRLEDVLAWVAEENR